MHDLNLTILHNVTSDHRSEPIIIVLRYLIGQASGDSGSDPVGRLLRRADLPL